MLVAYRQDVPRDRNKIPWQDKPLHPFADAAKATNSAASSEERLWQEALRLIHRSLEQADASTCRQIGLSYRDGSSLTPQDGILAHVWLSRAAELNDIKAHADLVELERSLSSDQIAQAKKRYLPKCKRPV
jgi:TPR repeat protein